MMISHAILLKMRKVSEKSCRENQNTHFVFDKFFYKTRTVYEIMWQNMAGSVGNVILRMRFACWATNVTDPHSDYVILLIFYSNNCNANAPEYYYYVHCLSCSYILQFSCVFRIIPKILFFFPRKKFINFCF